MHTAENSSKRHSNCAIIDFSLIKSFEDILTKIVEHAGSDVFVSTPNIVFIGEKV